MKLICTLFVGFCCTTFCFAQKVELSAGVSGNLYNYTGSIANSNVDFNTFPVYSKKLTAGYGANVQIKLIAKDGFTMGLQTGYDVLRNTANVNYYMLSFIYYSPLPAGFVQNSSAGNATGYITTTSKFINVNPFLGYRIKKKHYSIDLALGAEIGFAVENQEHKVLTSPYIINESFYYSRSGKNSYQEISKQDYRIKGGAGINYRRWGFNLSYAHGINSAINVKSGTQDVSNGKAYSQLLRLGVNYRIF